MDADSDLTFWPAFADFMLALVLIFLAFFAITQFEGGPSIEAAQNCQEKLRRDFGADSTVLFKADAADPLLYRVTFSDSLLFKSDDATLSERGKAVMDRLAAAIQKQLRSVVEIQIHGHADTFTSKRFESNVHLAAARSASVLKYLETQRIDPYTHPISASSYGDFSPVSLESAADRTKPVVLRANSTDAQRSANRRVEFLIRYGGTIQDCN